MNYKIDIKPISVNEIFKGKKYKTAKYDLFISDMLKLLPKTIEFPDKENVKLAIEFGFSTKASDLDNYLKGTIDCFVKKYGVDDKHIYEIHCFKAIVKKGQEYIKFKIY